MRIWKVGDTIRLTEPEEFDADKTPTVVGKCVCGDDPVWVKAGSPFPWARPMVCTAERGGAWWYCQTRDHGQIEVTADWWLLSGERAR